MVTQQLIEAAGRAADAGVAPKPAANSAGGGEIARLGAAAQLYAVKTKCDCPSCQALRKMADLTMAAILEVSLEQAAAEPPAAAEPAPPTEALEASDAPGDDPSA